MRPALLAVLLLLAPVALTGCATPYVSATIETSDRTPQLEASSRFEVGASRNGFDVYLYHESDPRNGFKQRANESEDGMGIRYKHEFRF